MDIQKLQLLQQLRNGLRPEVQAALKRMVEQLQKDLPQYDVSDYVDDVGDDFSFGILICAPGTFRELCDLQVLLVAAEGDQLGANIMVTLSHDVEGHFVKGMTYSPKADTPEAWTDSVDELLARFRGADLEAFRAEMRNGR